MSITSNITEHKVNISISGRFDFSCHKAFREAYRDIPEGTEYEFIIDMSETEYVDSSALAMILLLRERAGNEQARISIEKCRSVVKDILMLSNFHKLFKIS